MGCFFHQLNLYFSDNICHTAQFRKVCNESDYVKKWLQLQEVFIHEWKWLYWKILLVFLSSGRRDTHKGRNLLRASPIGGWEPGATSDGFVYRYSSCKVVSNGPSMNYRETQWHLCCKGSTHGPFTLRNTVIFFQTKICLFIVLFLEGKWNVSIWTS